MAYVSKEKKAKIVAATKPAIPKTWKATFAVSHHSGIVLTISRAPKSVLTDYIGNQDLGNHDLTVNIYHLNTSWKGKTLKILEKILAGLNTDNFDNSDAQSDYFHIGHYVDINFGKWNKPCLFV